MNHCVVCLQELSEGGPTHTNVATCLADLARRVAVLDAKVTVAAVEIHDFEHARPALALCTCGWFAVAPRDSALGYGKAHAGGEHDVEYHAMGLRWKVGARGAPGWP